MAKNEKQPMNEKTVMKVLLILLSTVGICWAGGCAESLATRQLKKADANSVETILKRLNQRVAELESYQGQIEYLFSQPLLESQTLRKGVLYYTKCNEKSKLRINFKTLKQDDEKEQKYVEQYIFDGIWLTHIDYQIKAVKRYQLAEPNEAVDAFELVRENFPIIGFSETEDLKKEFEIKLVEQQGKKAAVIGLHLKVKPGSIYKDDYTLIDFWIDKKLSLPAKIIAVSVEEDVYEIKLVKPKVNKRIDKKVFEFKIPEGFGKPEIIPSKKTRKESHR